MSVVIEIYKKSASKPTVSATFHDNDQCCLFSTTLFQEALYHFETTSGDPFDIFPYTPEEISKHHKALRHRIKDLLEYISIKINSIVNNIQKLGDSYLGRKTYH